jgi:hypothetical protein
MYKVSNVFSSIDTGLHFLPSAHSLAFPLSPRLQLPLSPRPYFGERALADAFDQLDLCDVDRLRVYRAVGIHAVCFCICCCRRRFSNERFSVSLAH